MTIAKLAQRLYNAYRDHTGGKSAVNGVPIPRWEDQRPQVQEAWLAVATEAQRQLGPAQASLLDAPRPARRHLG